MLWPYGTHRKAGTPDSFNVGPTEIEIMMGPTPISWLAPVMALWSPHTINVDDLCSTDPPSPENWGINDLLNGLNPANHQFEIDKLIRMARANAWPTYCEFNDPPTGDNGLTGQPTMIDTVAEISVSGGDGPSTWVWPLNDQCDFLLTAGFEDVHPVGAQVPLVVVNRPSGPQPVVSVFEWVYGSSSYAAGTWGKDMVLRDVNGVDAPMSPHSGTITITPPANEGQWTLTISRWLLNVRPPTPVPFPPAPVEPLPYQFSDACAAALCAMSTDWVARAPSISILPGMVTENHGLLVALAAQLAALGTGDAAGGPVELSGGWDFTGGLPGVQLPPEVVGMFLTVDLNPAMGVMGTNVPGVWDAGWLAWGHFGGFHSSQRIKHNGQIFLRPDAAEYVSIDLSPGAVGGSYYWLVRSPPIP